MKNRKKAVHAELRKESKTFDGWLKYEITIRNEDGSTEKVPAYGKDLQDALSRVVHDEKIKKVLPVITKIPSLVWAVIWFVSIFFITLFYTQHGSEMLGDSVGLLYVSTIAVLISVTVSINNWFRLKNKDK